VLPTTRAPPISPLLPYTTLFRSRFSGTLSDAGHLAVRGRGAVLRRAFPPHDANACGALRVLRLPWSPAVSGRVRPRARPGALAGHRRGGGDGRQCTAVGRAARPRDRRARP